LIERMLTEIFGMEWYKVHDEAEQLEHAVSADFERRLLEKLGTGEACPHGNRVEGDTPQDRRDRGLRPLDPGTSPRCSCRSHWPEPDDGGAPGAKPLGLSVPLTAQRAAVTASSPTPTLEVAYDTEIR